MNDNDTWTRIGLAAARVRSRLEEQRSNDERESNPEKETEREREKERFLEMRLCEIDRFERRFKNRT